MPAQIIRTSSKLGESIHLGLEISQMFARTIEFAAQHLKFFTRGNVFVLQDIHLVSKRICRSHCPIYFLSTHAIGLRLQVSQVFASFIEFAPQRPNSSPT